MAVLEDTSIRLLYNEIVSHSIKIQNISLTIYCNCDDKHLIEAIFQHYLTIFS